MWLTFWTLSCLLLLSDGRSSGSRSSSRPRTSSGSSYPRQPTSSGNSYPPRQTSAPSYSWNRPSTPSQTPSQSTNYGWSQPKTDAGKSPAPGSTYGWQRPSQPTTGTNYGWSQPKTDAGKSPPPGSNSNSQPTSGTNYGWSQPKTDAGKVPPPGSNFGPQRPPQPTAGTNFGRNPPKTESGSLGTSVPSYGWQKPSPAAPHSWPSATQKPFNNPTVTQQKAFDNSYGKGYDRGFQSGVQQATRINPAYYPHQSQFGYPGQGIAYGNHGPTYGGMSMFGSPHNYGYPISSSYGYNSYGSGGLTKGLLIGAVGGYVLNSALHSLHPRTSFSQNGWGYQGAGYGSDYPYRRVEHTTINNYFGESAHRDNTDNKVPDNWVHCVAYDPMTDTTLTNPNCSCFVTFETDPTTNTTTANHNCTTQWGHQMEKTPATDVEILDMIGQKNSLEKLQQNESELAKQRTMVYQQLNNIFTMGSFTA